MDLEVPYVQTNPETSPGGFVAEHAFIDCSSCSHGVKCSWVFSRHFLLENWPCLLISTWCTVYFQSRNSIEKNHDKLLWGYFTRLQTNPHLILGHHIFKAPPGTKKRLHQRPFHQLPPKTRIRSARSHLLWGKMRSRIHISWSYGVKSYKGKSI